ncbi:MAG: hypothetical protein WA705_26305 [Candidatus Ozemobacteraceae bacterium]
MERLTTLAGTLLAINAVVYFFFGNTSPPDLAALQLHITTIEQTLPLREANTAWYEKVHSLLEDPPQEDPADLLARLRDLATGWHFEVVEAANRGGNPTSVVFNGHGSYQAIAALVAEIERSDATRLDGLSLVHRDDEDLDASFMLSVRKGPWSDQACDQRPDPTTKVPVIHQLINDPFNPQKAVVVAPTQKPPLKFTGYFSNNAHVTAIIEIGNNVILLIPGDQLPTGERLLTATADQLEIQDKGGARWVYEMEKVK